jgi:Protein of unknown function (DUF1573)
MRLKATLIALILAAAVVVVAAQKKAANNTPGSGQPKLAMDSFEHSFGTIKAGTALNHTFKVKNDGKAPLEITNVSPACGCTTTNYDKVIAPGQTGGISLAIDKTESYSGEVVKTAEVTTNDPNKSRFTLTLRANVTAK